MQRINTSDGKFHAGNPATGELGTIVTRDFMQSLQEELAGVCEAAGLVLDANDNTQILQAIRLLARSTAAPSGPSADKPAAVIVGQQHLHTEYGLITVWQVAPPVWKNSAGVEV